MDDRVADVLAQRAALDHSFIAGVLLSIFLHASLIAAAIYLAMHTPAPKIASVLNIRLAPMAPPKPVAGARKPAPVVAQPVASPRPAAPKIESPKPQPLKPANTNKPAEKNTVPLSPFGKSEKKGSENPSTREPVNPSTPPETPGVSTSAIEGGDFPYTIYIDRMTTLVGSHFFRPQTTGTPVVIVFTIERDGSVRDVSVETPSNNSAWDRAAQRAVLESSPLPTLPFGYSGTYLRVHLKFR